MYIKRKIEDVILKYLDRPEIIAIVGSRQCGKTTLLKKIFSERKNANFLTFEDQGVLSLFENNIKQFVATYVIGKDFVFIDEFQYAKNGGKLLKYIYDTHHTKIIISGSSAIDLTVKAIKYLVGRIFVFNMYQFDFYEFLLYRDENYAKIYKQNKIQLKNFKNNTLALEQIKTLTEYYEEYSIWGGYPAVVLADNKEVKREIIKNIYNTYFLRDVKSILGLVDDFKLGKLIKGLALQVGNMVEYNELALISEFSVPTVKKYLNFLSKTYIAELITPFYKNKRKEIVKNKKVYFYDIGLRNYILDDFRPLENRTDLGGLLENLLWIQLLKNDLNSKYWRDRNKNEIDFIIELGENRTIAIEVKNNKNKCPAPPLSFTKDYPDIKYYCGYLKTKDQEEKNNKLFLPLI
jgi:uncharacterized protein